jgi:adenine-specific DNA-methyltransferase
MDHERPRLVTNEAQVVHLNSLYGVKLYSARAQIGREFIPMASLNSVTLLGSEFVGRSYGGGLLKLEPREADRIPLPSLSLLEAAEAELRAIRPQVNLALRRGDLSGAVQLVDRELLVKGLGIQHAELEALRHAREVLFSRRRARAESQRDQD